MINLDELTPDQLQEAAQVFRNLEGFAKQRAWAIRNRKAGDTEIAIIQEQQCERYYRSLPDWAKWR